MTTHKLEYPDGTPADPPTYLSATGTAWNLGDPLYIGRRTLRVIATRLDEGGRRSGPVASGGTGLARWGCGRASRTPKTRSVLPRRTPQSPARPLLYEPL
jgi:hypothetical protein